MSIDPDEICDFISDANALLINLGTLDSERVQCIEVAINQANAAQKPWVLDPVLVHRSPKRLAFARQLIKRHPAIVRANADEVLAIAGEKMTVDEFTLSMQPIVAQTGQPDIVTDGNTQTRVSNGHELMTQVTGLGCATSALAAAFSAVTDNALDAAISALLVAGVAGEIAAESASGPGSLQTEILDSLYRLDDNQIIERSRIE